MSLSDNVSLTLEVKFAVKFIFQRHIVCWGKFYRSKIIGGGGGGGEPPPPFIQ